MQKYHAPYEKAPNQNVSPVSLKAHGGYGILVERTVITGPYFYYENAFERSRDLFGSIVVRWADYAKPVDPGAEPLTLQVQRKAE